MNCESLLIPLVQIMLGFGTLATLGALYFLEKYSFEPKSNTKLGWIQLFTGYFFVIFTSRYLLRKGKKWRILFIFGLAILVLAISIIKFYQLGACLK